MGRYLRGVAGRASATYTAGTAATSTHSTRLRPLLRSPVRSPAASWLSTEPGRAWRRVPAVRLAAVSTVQAAAAAPVTQISAKPRSPIRPAWWEGMPVIHKVTKWAGKTRVMGRAAPPNDGPNITSRIHAKKISTVPLTGLAARAPMMAPMAR